MKKSILITLLLSSAVLTGCNRAIKEAVGNMVLGEDLIQASEKRRCL